MDSLYLNLYNYKVFLERREVFTRTGCMLLKISRPLLVAMTNRQNFAFQVRFQLYPCDLCVCL